MEIHGETIEKAWTFASTMGTQLVSYHINAVKVFESHRSSSYHIVLGAYRWLPYHCSRRPTMQQVYRVSFAYLFVNIASY